VRGGRRGADSGAVGRGSGAACPAPLPAQGQGIGEAAGPPALEDKRLQRAGAKLLGAIDEDVRECSHSYRPSRRAQDAMGELTCQRMDGCQGYRVDADSRGVFAALDHDWWLKMRRLGMDDRACLKRIRTGLKAGRLDTDPRQGVCKAESSHPCAATSTCTTPSTSGSSAGSTPLSGGGVAVPLGG
jgi:hypothetical protein